MKKLLKGLLRGGLGVLSGLLYILSIPKVRNMIWGKAIGKSREKIVDAKARVVESDREKKKGLFG